MSAAASDSGSVVSESQVEGSLPHRGTDGNGEMTVDAAATSSQTDRSESRIIHAAAQPSLPYHILSMRRFSPSVYSFDGANSLLAHLRALSSQQSQEQHLPVSVSVLGQGQDESQEGTELSVLAVEEEFRILVTTLKVEPTEDEQRYYAPPFQQCVALIQGQRIVLDHSDSSSSSSPPPSTTSHPLLLLSSASYSLSPSHPPL